MGGREFLVTTGLASGGLYAYCVSLAGGMSGAGVTYDVGIFRDAGLYFPAYSYFANWGNPGPGGVAQVGDTLTFSLNFSNNSPVDIPGNISFSVDYDETYLQYLSADLSPTTNNPGYLQRYGLIGGDPAGDVATVTVNFQALNNCSDLIPIDYTTAYYFTGNAWDSHYIIGKAVFLPAVINQ